MAQIDIESLDKDELERVRLMLDISKIQADIEATRQSVEESRLRGKQIEQSIKESQQGMEATRQSIKESQATIEKMRKELAWYPYLQIATTLVTGLLTGGVVVFFLSKVL